MLDTDISSYVMKRSHDAVLRRLQKVPVGDVCISVITKSELLYGVELSPRRSRDQAALDAYLRYVEVFEYPDEAALHYAQIRAALKGQWNDDWRERFVDRCTRTQPSTHARDEQHAGIRPGAGPPDRELD